MMAARVCNPTEMEKSKILELFNAFRSLNSIGIDFEGLLTKDVGFKNHDRSGGVKPRISPELRREEKNNFHFVHRDGGERNPTTGMDSKEGDTD